MRQHLTVRDLLTTVLAVAIAVPYVGYLVRGSMPFVQDARGMTGVGLVLGLIAAVAAGRRALGKGTLGRFEAVIAVVTLGLGIGSLVAEGGALLAPFMAALLVLWAVVTLHHAGAFAGHRVFR